MSLQVGLVAPHAGRAAGPRELARCAAAAEEAGLHSLWVGDHLVLPEQQNTPYPYRASRVDGTYQVPSDGAFLEAFQSLAYLAAVTSTVRLGVSVGILPYRHPLHWAKAVGTLSVLSGGRMVLGAGAGWLREEFEALGLNFAHRGDETDDVLRALRELWGSPDHAISSHGVRVHVVPAFDASPPEVWIGGTTRRALRRVAEYGDMWHPMMHRTSPAKLASSLAELEEARGAAVSAAVYVTLRLQSEREESHPWETNELRGPLDYCAEVLYQYREAGMTHVVVSTGGSAERRVNTVAELVGALR